MDLTVEVMLPPRGAADYSQSAHPKWRVLSLVAVYPLRTVEVVGMPRTGYIHVTGIPTPPGWAALSMAEILQRINRILATAVENELGEAVEKRRWAGVASAMPAVIARKLLEDRQVTVTWSQFKGAVRNVLTAQNLSEADFA